MNRFNFERFWLLCFLKYHYTIATLCYCMSGYNCSIEYIAGPTNTCADLLSRHPDNVQKASDIQNSEDVEDKTVLDVNDNL